MGNFRKVSSLDYPEMQCTFSLKFRSSQGPLTNYFVSKMNTVVGGSVWAVIIRVVQCATLVYLAQRRRKVQKSVWVTINWWLFLFSFLYLLNMGGHGPVPPASATPVTFCLTNKHKNTSAAQVYDKKRPGLVSNFCTKAKGRYVEVYGPGLSDPEGTAFDR